MVCMPIRALGHVASHKLGRTQCFVLRVRQCTSQTHACRWCTLVPWVETWPPMVMVRGLNLSLWLPHAAAGQDMARFDCFAALFIGVLQMCDTQEAVNSSRGKYQPGGPVPKLEHKTPRICGRVHAAKTTSTQHCIRQLTAHNCTFCCALGLVLVMSTI